MHQWSADEVSERWMISIDVFSRLFLAEGPGGERDSFLAARAGTAGRIARYCIEGRDDVKPLLNVKPFFTTNCVSKKGLKKVVSVVVLPLMVATTDPHS